MPPFKDRTGKRYGRLVAIRPMGKGKKEHQYQWLMRCDCGNEKIISGNSITRTFSCGCYLKDRIRETKTKHGHAKWGEKNSPTYKSWRAMLDRCRYQKNASYHNYGGRGIIICERWRKDFRNFLADMGKRPLEAHLHRIDSEKGYYKENCVWMDKVEHERLHRRNDEF